MQKIDDKDIYELEEELLSFQSDLMSTSHDALLQIINKKLTATEKRILTIYAFSGSSRKAEQYSNIKFRRICMVMKEIRVKIKKELKRIETNNNKIVK